MNIPLGFCQCGCGGKTKIAKRNQYRQGWTKGQPVRFILYHKLKGSESRMWKGGRSQHGDGYDLTYLPDHPRANRGYVLTHILVAEKALGKALPEKAEVHHVNGQRSGNENTNLVICPNVQYHRLLHRRARAYLSCGHSHFRQCKFCRQWDDPQGMYIEPQGSAWHRPCQNHHQNARYAAKKRGSSETR